jgi:hypothetical protein
MAVQRKILCTFARLSEPDARLVPVLVNGKRARLARYRLPLGHLALNGQIGLPVRCPFKNGVNGQNRASCKISRLKNRHAYRTGTRVPCAMLALCRKPV